MFLTKNPQIIHIVCEIVIFFTLIFWILSTRKKISLQIERLLVRFEEQEEKIQRMELFLEKMHMDNMTLNQQLQKMKEENLKDKPEVRKSEVRKQKIKSKISEIPEIQKFHNLNDLNDLKDLKDFKDIPDINSLFQMPLTVPNKVNTPSVIIREEEDTDSDLDEELKEELEELKDELLKFEKTKLEQIDESLRLSPSNLKDLNTNSSSTQSPITSPTQSSKQSPTTSSTTSPTKNDPSSSKMKLN